MKMRPVTVVRIYVRESEHLLEKLVKFLHDDGEVAGVTVLQGIEGSSDGSQRHPSFLADMHLVVEFFDEPARVDAVIHSLVRRFPLQHIISWPATSHLPKD